MKDKPLPLLRRQFFKSPRGPAINDEDVFYLVFDMEAGRFVVHNEWSNAAPKGGQPVSGVSEVELSEFYSMETSPLAARNALTKLISQLFLVSSEFEDGTRI